MKHILSHFFPTNTAFSPKKITRSNYMLFFMGFQCLVMDFKQLPSLPRLFQEAPAAVAAEAKVGTVRCLLGIFRG